MNEMPQRTTVGIPWFIREDYDTFRLLVPHRAWHTTFDQWLAAATQVLDQQQRAGVLVFKVEVQSDAFALWCQDTVRRTDRQALLDYANMFARGLLAANDGH